MVFDSLCYQVYVGIQFQVIIKEVSCFVEVEVVFLYFIFFNDIFGCSIGIREISLYFFVVVYKRYGVDGCYIILKEIIGVIIIFQCLIFFLIVFGFRVYGVIVLEFG